MIELRVASVEQVTARIKLFEFVGVDGAALPAFIAGSHIDLELGNGDERSYSLLNDQGETHRYQVAVLREHDGRGGSAWMHDVLRAGDVIRAAPPGNDFRLSEAGDHHLLIAGGIGITPMLPMAARLREIGREYAIHYCARSVEEAAFAQLVAERHGERAQFHYDGGDAQLGLDVSRLLASRPTAGHAYVCGPAGLIRAVRDAGRDWPSGTIHFELFKGSNADLGLDSLNEPFDILCKRAGKRFTIPADQSIMDVLKAEGFRIRSLCHEGVCGTCRVGLVSGDVDHRDECLDEDERDEALQVCVSRAKPGQTLVLDI